MHRKKVIRISPHSKESAYNVGDPGLIMGREDPLVKGLATHASILAWRIPCSIPGLMYSSQLFKPYNLA